jgi:allophanate hydrolase subunit 2
MPDTDLAPAHPPAKTLTVWPGPRLDWFADSAWSLLLHEPWTVTAECDRVAVRLDGPALDRVRTEELPSEGLLRGAIQVPASGQPLIFLSDHPVTGGYPVVGVLSERSCDQAAQLRPGDQVTFRPPSTH